MFKFIFYEKLMFPSCAIFEIKWCIWLTFLMKLRNTFYYLDRSIILITIYNILNNLFNNFQDWREKFLPCVSTSTSFFSRIDKSANHFSLIFFIFSLISTQSRTHFETSYRFETTRNVKTRRFSKHLNSLWNLLVVNWSRYYVIAITAISSQMVQ